MRTIIVIKSGAVPTQYVQFSSILSPLGWPLTHHSYFNLGCFSVCELLLPFGLVDSFGISDATLDTFQGLWFRVTPCVSFHFWLPQTGESILFLCPEMPTTRPYPPGWRAGKSAPIMYIEWEWGPHKHFSRVVLFISQWAYGLPGYFFFLNEDLDSMSSIILSVKKYFLGWQFFCIFRKFSCIIDQWHYKT